MMSRPYAARRRACVLLGCALAAVSASAGAQSSLSTQGFGYPPGQVSTRAISMGTSIGELDPVSPRNPASIARWGRPGLYLQYDPEFRRVTSAGGRDGTVNIRFPLLGGATRIGRRISASVSISNLLDRTYTTESLETLTVDGTPLQATTRYQSTGGLNDVRLAVAYDLSPTLSVGLGGHVVTGENRVSLLTQFDREGFVPLTRQSEVNYSGTAFSAGVNWVPGYDLAVAGSLRLEGALRANRSDVAIDEGRLPSRRGFSVAYTGVPGAVFAAGANWEQWSRMDLGSEAVSAQDTREIGLGVEVEGPRVRSAIVALRGGYRTRDLPFGVTYTGGDEGSSARYLTEQGFSLGAGIPLANVAGASRAMLDIGVQRASRSGVPGVTERAWTLSVGLAVRP